MHPVFLTLDELLEMHTEQIETYGGAHGLRDLAALESALAVPQSTFDGIWPPHTFSTSLKTTLSSTGTNA